MIQLRRSKCGADSGARYINQNLKTKTTLSAKRKQTNKQTNKLQAHLSHRNSQWNEEGSDRKAERHQAAAAADMFPRCGRRRHGKCEVHAEAVLVFVWERLCLLCSWCQWALIEMSNSRNLLRPLRHTQQVCRIGQKFWRFKRKIIFIVAVKFREIKQTFVQLKLTYLLKVP